jgi:hypothetical protein
MSAKSFDTALEKVMQRNYEGPVCLQHDMVKAMPAEETFQIPLSQARFFFEAPPDGALRGIER